MKGKSIIFLMQKSSDEFGSEEGLFPLILHIVICYHARDSDAKINKVLPMMMM
jgi:hypothetical protein